MNEKHASPQRGRTRMSDTHAPPQRGRAQMNVKGASLQKGRARMSVKGALSKKGRAQMNEVRAPPQRGGAPTSDIHASPPRGDARERVMATSVPPNIADLGKIDTPKHLFRPEAAAFFVFKRLNHVKAVDERSRATKPGVVRPVSVTACRRVVSSFG